MKDLSADANILTRRHVLKTGFMGSLFLSTVSLTAGLSGCATAPAVRPADQVNDADAYRFLSEDDIQLWTALTPVILSDSLPKDATLRRTDVVEVTHRIDTAIYYFSPAKQQELRQLFDLLNLGITRSLAAGVWSAWPNASPESVSDFLEGWRTSSIGVFNQGYAALTQLAGASYFSNPAQSALANYPGPPKWATDALPQFQHA